jgi:hypothetical protein
LIGPVAGVPIPGIEPSDVVMVKQLERQILARIPRMKRRF